MSSSQIPLWITYSLAVIAILGPIGGALIGGTITAKRDDRRWEREREREELRWQREREQQFDERRHQLRLDWRERRLDVYSEYLSAAEALQEPLTALFSLSLTHEQIETIENDFEPHSRRAAAALKVIQVIGSPDLTAICVKLLGDARFHFLEFKGPMPVEAKSLRLSNWIDTREQAVQAVRIELDVEISKNLSGEPLNPSPPSALTS
ncbi:hypothetical protein [Umezawaea sp. Da 62-37]|uniref:hypothetical protein n=1 Tax=Umezawaea sp. Da 62-37 TaxID=3075927 RepID=UPI0028F70F39|nr:hypothetical protein [Umezawaea sp. Da 62-37]WNV82223.1 hypothetical protein RM788_28895 [Umezawaea sp. Da 62-37]